MKNSIIFILDDDEQILDTIDSFLKNSGMNYDTYKFLDSKSMMTHPKLKYVDLFILDIRLGVEKTGKEVCSDIINSQKNVTCLFVSGGDYKFESFEELSCTYDFIKKPFPLQIFNNRVKTLLRVSKEYKRLEQTKLKIGLSLIDILEYSDLYIVLLDDNFLIRSCSYMLAKHLEYNSSEELIGKNWDDFLPPEMDKLKTLFSDDKKRIHKEFTNDIITKSGERISTKWFNTRIENGIIWTFSIGIPLTKKISKEDSIETMRSYWEDIIQKDRTTINIFKEITVTESTNKCLKECTDQCLEI